MGFFDTVFCLHLREHQRWPRTQCSQHCPSLQKSRRPDWANFSTWPLGRNLYWCPKKRYKRDAYWRGFSQTMSRHLSDVPGKNHTKTLGETLVPTNLLLGSSPTTKLRSPLDSWCVLCTFFKSSQMKSHGLLSQQTTPGRATIRRGLIPRRHEGPVRHSSRGRFQRLTENLSGIVQHLRCGGASSRKCNFLTYASLTPFCAAVTPVNGGGSLQKDKDSPWYFTAKRPLLGWR